LLEIRGTLAESSDSLPSPKTQNKVEEVESHLLVSQFINSNQRLQSKSLKQPLKASIRKEGITAHLNPILASLPVSWDTFIWSIFEGSI